MASIALFGLALAGCDDRPDQWDAFVSHGEGMADRQEVIRGFKSFELCQAAALDRVRDIGEQAFYECGYKCGPNPKYGGMNVCKETRD